MDLKTRMEVLPCGKCEDMIGCDTCIFVKEAKELYKQIRTEVIAEISREIRLLYGNEYEKQIRADAIDEIIEYYKPCNDCGACLEYDRDYFKKKCEMDMQISYTELVADLEQLKEQKNG